jgi:cyclase
MVKTQAGEVIFQSVKRDGMMNGYDIETMQSFKHFYDIPVVILGGCGNYQHMLDAFQAGSDACAASSLFCFSDSNPLRAKRWLRNHQVHVRSS